jgi:1,4-dihydroxy-2-naphthoate octaprenyltransferase
VTAQAAPQITPARAWLLASRPATLPAAAVPVLVGIGAAIGEGATFKPLIFAVTLVCALFIQIGTNFANDYSDFHRGADHEGRLGPTRVTQSGLISQEGVRRGIIVAFGIAAVLGLYLAWVGGWPIVVIGVLSILAGLAYTGGPFPFGYYGLGDVFVFVFFGLVAVMGTAYLQSGTWSSFALVLSIPIGLLVTNILVVNNLRDLPTDKAAGKKTLAVRMGDRATRWQYAVFVWMSYFTLSSRAFGPQHQMWLLLPWVTSPFAVYLNGKVLRLSGRDLNPMLKKSGQLLLVFGVLLTIGAALSAQ